MKKVFVDKDIYSKPWFRKLSSKHKNLWFWLFTHCDMAGVITVDWDGVSFQCGEFMSPDDLPAMEDNVIVLNAEKFKYLLPGYVDFQYGTMAEISSSSKCSVHRGVWKCLNSHGLKYPVDRSNPFK